MSTLDCPYSLCVDTLHKLCCHATVLTSVAPMLVARLTLHMLGATPNTHCALWSTKPTPGCTSPNVTNLEGGVTGTTPHSSPHNTASRQAVIMSTDPTLQPSSVPRSSIVLSSNVAGTSARLMRPAPTVSCSALPHATICSLGWPWIGFPYQ